MPLLLASASPRRRDLLEQIGLTFTVQAVEIDETPFSGELPEQYVQRLALAKAAAVFALHPVRHRLLVLGADTTVVCPTFNEDGSSSNDLILNKPMDEADAEYMLGLLSGQTHRVLTGVALVSSSSSFVECESTEVDINPLSAQDIATYIASGEPMGKAGAYAIQGRGARFIPRIRGDYSNVVGLPLARVSAMLARVR